MTAVLCARFSAFVGEIVGTCHAAATVLLLLDQVANYAVVLSTGDADAEWLGNEEHSRAATCSHPNSADAVPWSDIFYRQLGA